MASFPSSAPTQHSPIQHLRRTQDISALSAVPVSIVTNLLGSLQIVRELFAYYANWRAASRVFDEALDTTLRRAALSQESEQHSE
jgi:hypothetical protein